MGLQAVAATPRPESRKSSDFPAWEPHTLS
jgi:hypothetical protein